MKKYNEILEAVHKGIQLVLDDYDDIEQTSKKAGQYKDVSTTQTMLLTVDLGLPSGNLWYKYNLGVKPNKLFAKTSYYGDYYSWGELEPKERYGQDTYKYGLVSIRKRKDNTVREYKYTKYCNIKIEGYKGKMDFKRKLELDDDVAHVKLGGKFVIPTRQDFQELIDNTTQEYKENYNNIAGLNGLILKSKVNDNSIFIPCAGTRCPVGGINPTGTYGRDYEIYLWTSNLYESICGYAYTLIFHTYNKEKEDKLAIQANMHRYMGIPIRPVYKNG